MNKGPSQRPPEAARIGQLLQRRLPYLRRKYNVKRLALFGSVARDRMRPGSDVDVLVEFSQPIGLFAFLDLKTELEHLLGRPVDLVTADALKPQMRDKILGEAIHAA
ncbi:MAG: nucleotidyltransferase family protein [Chloroflexi bacterium]|nr:nucleotidyltransferase family protein [Chloroflexota bacterium]